MSWKEYDLENRSIADWLPWGGIVDPCVVRNKDDSFFGILEYQPYPEEGGHIDLPAFRNGWSLWNEHQHIPTAMGFEDRYFLVLCWNPFLDAQKRIMNPLGPKKIPEVDDKKEFRRTLDRIAEAVSKVTTCHLLAYQEIIDFLMFTLSMGEVQMQMPDVPLYLDAVLSEDLAIDFSGNSIRLGERKEILAVSLPAMTDSKEQAMIDSSFFRIPYRHVQRLLLMSEKSAKKTLETFTDAWCPDRKSVRKMLLDKILGKLNGYYSDSYFLLTEKAEEERVNTYIQNVLNLLHIAYVMERYNRKDIWWGSLPGIFRANITPPQMGFSGLDEILYHPAPQEEKGGSAELVQAEPLPQE